MQTTLIVSALVLATLASCSDQEDKEVTDDAGVLPSVACYVADQFRCIEYPMPTAEQDDNSAVECSSLSGEVTHPAACPTEGYLGKCTTGTGAATRTERFYTGADATYAADFCVNTALGTWTTTP